MKNKLSIIILFFFAFSLFACKPNNQYNEETLEEGYEWGYSVDEYGVTYTAKGSDYLLKIKITDQDLWLVDGEAISVELKIEYDYSKQEQGALLFGKCFIDKVFDGRINVGAESTVVDEVAAETESITIELEYINSEKAINVDFHKLKVEVNRIAEENDLDHCYNYKAVSYDELPDFFLKNQVNSQGIGGRTARWYYDIIEIEQQYNVFRYNLKIYYADLLYWSGDGSFATYYSREFVYFEAQKYGINIGDVLKFELSCYTRDSQTKLIEVDYTVANQQAYFY